MYAYISMYTYMYMYLTIYKYRSTICISIIYRIASAKHFLCTIFVHFLHFY